MSKETNNEIMTVDNPSDVAELHVDDLTNSVNNFYCSISNSGSREDEVKIYNALNSASEQLSDHRNEVIDIVDVAAHPIKVVSKATGELVNTLRVVLIDKDGVCYQAVSIGVVSSLQKIFSIIGMPSWNDNPVKVKPVEIKTNNGFKVLSLELV